MNRKTLLFIGILVLVLSLVMAACTTATEEPTEAVMETEEPMETE